MTLILNNYVLEEDPNDVEPLEYVYNRQMTILDNNVGIQQIYDVAGFVSQKYSWYCHGREQYWKLRDLFTMLGGRRVPIWIPTFYSDFELVANDPPGGILIDVKRCGYTETGGPFEPNRRYVLIHQRDGVRQYRTILNSAVNGDLERLEFETQVYTHLTPENTRRISFLVLSRLDQDEIEFVHHSDSIGMTTVTATFHNQGGVKNIEFIYEMPIDPTAEPPEGDIIHDPFKPGAA